MQHKKFTSISKKLVLLLSGSAVIVLALFTLSFFLTSYQTTKREYIKSLQNVADILAQSLIAPVDFGDSETAANLLKTLNIDNKIDGAYILKEDKIFASYMHKDVDRTVLEKKLKNLYEKKDLKTKINYMNSSSIIVSSPVMLDGEYMATFSIIANKKGLNETIKKEVLILLLILLFIIVFIALIASKLKKIFTDPIIRLKKVMEKVGKNNNYTLHIKNDRSDEFAILYDGFNKMIEKIGEQNMELEGQKEFVQTILDSQEQLIVITDGERIISVNETFLSFFAVDDIETFILFYDAKCICDTFNTNAPKEYLQKEIDGMQWIDYVIANSSAKITHKVMISRENQDFVFSVTASKLPGNKELKSAVFTNITEMENAKQEVEAIHKRTQESIEYASLIQAALIPSEKKIQKYFNDFFTFWEPKDLVGGDIYLFEELRNEDECLLMVIDCTGHGVPGAFVTMLVKAIERQVVANINYGNEIVSPAKILSIFNGTMKHLLKQESVDSVSNVGFDGGILYYNKKHKEIKFAGAETALFYFDENDQLQRLKGSRHSVGYKKSDTNFVFQEYTIVAKEGMQFYITTDGYLDQNGGVQGFPFSRKRFMKTVEQTHHESMHVQKQNIKETLLAYQAEEIRNDDITVVGLRI